MRKASISQAKNSLSALIDSLESGSSVLILDRGRPVARLEPVAADPRTEQDGRLERLVRAGIVRPRRTAPPSALFDQPPPGAKAGVSVVEALLAERREGR